MNKFDDIIWAIELTYYSIRERAEQNFDTFLRAFTVVGDVEYEIHSFVKSYELKIHSHVIFTLYNDDGDTVTLKAEISDHRSICKINYIETYEEELNHD